MTKPTTWLLAGAALTLFAGVGVAVANEQQAQQQAAQDAAASPDRMERRERAERTERVERREQGEDREIRIYRDRDGQSDVTIINAGREQNLSALLQLRADQEAALKTFLEATRRGQDAAREHRVNIDREAEGRTTLQRLDEMQARATAQQAEMSRKIAAIKAFYAQLDAKQQKAFDTMSMLMVVGPTIGPMMLPHPMPIVHRMPMPPERPVPPTPPHS